MSVKLTVSSTGASFAHCYMRMFRASKLTSQPQANNMYGPANALYVDYNYAGTPSYIETLPERLADCGRLSQCRLAIFSAWRSMNKVTRDALCVGDKLTIPASDLVDGTSDMSAPGRNQTLGLFLVNFNSRHKYYYKWEMDIEDVLWIKLYDSKLDRRARCSPHS